MWQQVSGLFPNQVRAVIFEPDGPRLVLADQANPPSSPPLLVRECDPQGCRTAVTFSGQSIQLGSERLEVLTDLRGQVIVAGDASVWPVAAGALRITAQPLEGTL